MVIRISIDYYILLYSLMQKSADFEFPAPANLKRFKIYQEVWGKIYFSWVLLLLLDLALL